VVGARVRMLLRSGQGGAAWHLPHHDGSAQQGLGGGRVMMAMCRTVALSGTIAMLIGGLSR
jgi:hypothetical protein